MMTKKRRYLISFAVLVACVCIALSVLAILPPRPGVTKANFDRINDGMTLTEVEAILGKPSSVKEFISPSFRLAEWYRKDGRRETWVRFTDEVVANKGWVDEPILDKLRHWLHLWK